jgi:CMP-N,N'-diacetyllegionaminic acid synthase
MSRPITDVLAVIPARGGSRGIPRKNLAEIGGRSLVARAADVALAVPQVSVALLSTDDEEIATEGRRIGLDVPFLRPAALADDLATGAAAWRHAWLAAEAHYGRRFEVSILLEPSSPLRRVADVERTLDVLASGPHLAAATFSRTPAHYTPHKTLVVDEDGHVRTLLDQASSPSTRQLIPSQVHRDGLCYALWRATLLEGGTIIEERCAAVITERPVVNIDEPFDLELARWLDAREQDGR